MFLSSTMLKYLACLTCCGIILLAMIGAGRAQSQLSLVIGYPPGAIYDVYGRLVARHIGRHLPGNPNVVPQNMPGAGSLRSANYLYNIAPKDGYTIGLFARGIAMQPLFDSQGIQFDARKFNWLGSTSAEVSVVLASAAKPFKSIGDAQKNEMILAASGSGADSVIFPYILNGVIGTRFKVVTGYPGNADMLLAVERGEVDGNGATSWVNLVSVRPDWQRDRKFNVLLQMATRKHRDLAAIPLAAELAKNENDLKVLDLIFSRQEMAYPFVAPPDVPAPRLTALRAAFAATMKDSEFLADAVRLNLEVAPISADEVMAVVRRAYTLPGDVVARTKAVLAAGSAAQK
jgi:tripartite-type tricarboxylate transporter receptor subunit TctC